MHVSCPFWTPSKEKGAALYHKPVGMSDASNASHMTAFLPCTAPCVVNAPSLRATLVALASWLAAAVMPLSVVLGLAVMWS